jgi:alkylhydroperoxidase/carboxymuconolactone decarboxylase family protein YurZ
LLTISPSPASVGEGGGEGEASIPIEKRRKKMAENPLQIYETLDPDFLKLFNDTRAFAVQEGALSRKMKLLIAMALDAAEGAVEGVRNLAEQAMKAGATKQEIAETVRVAQYICGAGAVYTAARGLKELFK